MFRARRVERHFDVDIKDADTAETNRPIVLSCAEKAVTYRAVFGN